MIPLKVIPRRKAGQKKGEPKSYFHPSLMKCISCLKRNEFKISKNSVTFFKMSHMRKLILFSAVLLGILVFQSCSKTSSDNLVAPVRTNLINATIAPNGSYQLTIDNSDNVSISK